MASENASRGCGFRVPMRPRRGSSGTGSESGRAKAAEQGDEQVVDGGERLVEIGGDETRDWWRLAAARPSIGGSHGQAVEAVECQNGHTLCSTCKARVHNRCPTCRQELGDIRCLALEKVAESLELPCKYCSLGCPEIFPYYSKIKHEGQCSFRPYNCPYAGSECAVAGDIPFLVAHLRDDHKVDMHSGCTFNHRYVKSNPREVENATWMLTVFHCFGQYFCLHFEAFQLGMAPVYMAFLRFMGDENEARNYTYSLEVGGNGRKMVWEGTPRSIRDSHRKVRDSHDGLIIQRNMALFFSGGDRKELKLRVTGRIWKEQPNPEGTCIPNLCS
uniref:RING-type E3 ubiquitin transferase n=1 Tax=Aegilops tauschii TaxID=37682 RepID=M8CUV4_AEGTA